MFVATAHEYLLFYQKGAFTTSGVPMPDDYIKEYKLGEVGNEYRHIGLRKRGANSRRQDRPNMYYPFYYNSASNTLRLQKRKPMMILESTLKLSDGSDGCWRWGERIRPSRGIEDPEVKLVGGREEF